MSEALHLQVISGLGSRMRVVLGGIAYCEETHKQLVVDWCRRDPSEKLGVHPIKFNELWDSNIQETDTNNVWSASYCTWASTESLPHFPGVVRYRCDSLDAFLPWIKKPLGEYFYGNLSPTPELRSRIEEYTKILVHPVVGVHVRHTNCQPETASVEWFVQRLRVFPPNWNVFLCTDDAEVIPKFSAAFKDRLHVNSHVYRYDRKRIMGVAAEWYALAACDWMIGSNRSSYSQMAAFLRGAKRTGSLSKRSSVQGGCYEDMWNPPDVNSIQQVMHRYA